MTVDEDNASRMAAFMSGKYDLGWEYPGAINRTDWVQIKDTLKSKRPQLRTARSSLANVMSHISMRTDQKPFSDVRVRQAISLAVDRKGIIDAVAGGRGGRATRRSRRPCATGRIPWDQLGEGAQVLPVRPRGGEAAARRRRLSQRLPRHRLLHPLRLDDLGRHHEAPPEEAQGRRRRRQAGPEGIRRLHRDVLLRQFPLDDLRPADAATWSRTTSSTASTIPGELKNQSHINDPVVADLLVRQRRTFDLAKRRELVYEIQRYLAKQQYYTQLWSAVIYIAVWEGALKNYGPNHGYDYGGRLLAAWLDR